jgi:hypothetical protein
MKAAVLSSIFLLVALVTTSAFVTDRPASRTFAVPRLFLHPSQAKDLEACAYDLMREASSSSSTSSKADGLRSVSGSPSGPSSSDLKTSDACVASGGPIAWCRRVVQGGGGGGRRAAKATTANTKRP